MPPDLREPVSGVVTPGERILWLLDEDDAVDESLTQRVVIASSDAGAPVHLVEIAPGVSSLALPLPPFEVVPQEIYGGHAHASVQLCGVDPSLPGLCARRARSRAFRVEP
jgi:hypothetical protein